MFINRGLEMWLHVLKTIGLSTWIISVAISELPGKPNGSSKLLPYL